MPDRNFVRRRNSIPDQFSVISSDEQARLLNDPDIPLHPSVGHDQNHSDHPQSQDRREDMRLGSPDE